MTGWARSIDGLARRAAARADAGVGARFAGTELLATGDDVNVCPVRNTPTAATPDRTQVEGASPLSLKM